MTLNSPFESSMNYLLEFFLGALNRDEREVVYGDLLEAHESPSASVLQVLGLILKKQIFHLAEWQTWLILITIAFPFAVVLTQTARDFAGLSAIYSWMLINNTDAELLKNGGFWSGVWDTSWAIGNFALVILCCSWSCGRLIADLSRNARLAITTLFLFISLVVNIIGITFHAQASVIRVDDPYFPNGPVFAIAFYRDWFPFLIYGATVFLPLLLGVVRRGPVVQRSKALGIVSYGSAALVAIGLVEQRWLLVEMWNWRLIPASFLRLPSLLPFAALGPACFLLVEFGMRSSLHIRKRIQS